MLYNANAKLEKVTEPNGEIEIFESGEKSNILTAEERELFINLEKEGQQKFVVFYSKKYQKKLILMYSKEPEIDDEDLKGSAGLEVEIIYDETGEIKSFNSRGVFIFNEEDDDYTFSLNPKVLDIFGEKIFSEETMKKLKSGEMKLPPIASFTRLEMLIQERKTEKINQRIYYFLNMEGVSINQETSSFVQDIYPDDPLGTKIIDPISKNEDYIIQQVFSMNN